MLSVIRKCFEQNLIKIGRNWSDTSLDVSASTVSLCHASPNLYLCNQLRINKFPHNYINYCVCGPRDSWIQIYLCVTIPPHLPKLLLFRKSCYTFCSFTSHPVMSIPNLQSKGMVGFPLELLNLVFRRLWWPRGQPTHLSLAPFFHGYTGLLH